MGFKEYLAVISRRWHIFLPMMALVIGAHVLWVAYGQPQLYRASAMVVISPPIASEGLPIGRPITPMTRPETLREPPVLSVAVQLLLGERPFQAKEFETDDRQEFIARFTEQFAAEADGQDPRRLMDEIEGSLVLTMTKDERVITVEVTSDRPERALAFAWSVAEAARVFHNERCRDIIDKTLTEFRKQQEELEKEREVAFRDRTDFAKRTGFTNFPRYQEMIQALLLGIDGELSQLRGSQREVERTIDERVSRSQQGGDEIQAVAAEMGDSPRLRELNQELLRARLDHDMAVSRYTDKHPSLQALRVKVDRLERLIAEEQDSIIADGLKKWSAATRDLVKQSGAFALKLEVLKERKAALSREMFRLAEVNQEYNKIEDRSRATSGNLDRLQAQINTLEWAGIQRLGQVQIHNPADAAKKLKKQGTGVGPIMLSVLMAMIFALGVVYVLEYIDTRIKTEHDVRRFLGLPLLGKIPQNRNHLILDPSLRGDIAEKFNTAATLIRSTARELGMKSLIVTSAVPKEGKTTVAINVAVALARKGARVVLVDADLRMPRIHEVLNIPNRIGLSTVLQSQLDPRRIIDGVLSESEHGGSSIGAAEVLVPTSIENLFVMTSGPLGETPDQLLESDRLQRLVKELTASADFVIFDTPPVNNVGDALTVASSVDGCIFVVGSGLCEQHDVAWAKHLLANVQANLLGVFLNRYWRRGASGYYYYQRSGSQERLHAKTLA